MTDKKQKINMGYEILKDKGVNHPEKVDEYVAKIYTLIKDADFSIIEAETIVQYLLGVINADKKLILKKSIKELC